MIIKNTHIVSLFTQTDNNNNNNNNNVYILN